MFKLVVIITVLIQWIFLLAHDWSKSIIWLNMPWLKLGNIRGYTPIDIPQFLNLAYIAMKVFIWNLIQDERRSSYCYWRMDISVCLLSPTREHWTVSILLSKYCAVCWHFSGTLPKYLKDDKYHCLHLVQKYAQIFVPLHNLFWDVNSFLKAKLRETLSFKEQIHPRKYTLACFCVK